MSHRVLPRERVSLVPAFAGLPLHRVKPIFWESIPGSVEGEPTGVKK